MRRKSLRVVVVGIFIFLVALPAAAMAAEEKWPSRPITIYIGFAPGRRHGHDGAAALRRDAKIAGRCHAGRQHDGGQLGRRHGPCLSAAQGRLQPLRHQQCGLHLSGDGAFEADL